LIRGIYGIPGPIITTRRLGVELKATTKFEDTHFAQALNYLEAYNLEVGLLINFGESSLNFRRLTNKKFKSSAHLPQI
jgi:GxxExxY protein